MTYAHAYIAHWLLDYPVSKTDNHPLCHDLMQWYRQNTLNPKCDKLSQTPGVQ